MKNTKYEAFHNTPTNPYRNIFSRWGNLPWLEKRTILLVQSGSHSYGMATEASDIDFKGIAIAPKEYYIGIKSVFEQAERTHNVNNPDQTQECDATIYELRKALRLLSDCNPNMIEILYTDNRYDRYLMFEERLEHLGDRLVENRDLFLSQMAKHRFGGYAMAQLKRIQRHRRWLLNPPTHQPTRNEYSLPDIGTIPVHIRQSIDEAVKDKMRSWEIAYELMDESTKILVKGQIEDYLVDRLTANSDPYIDAARLLNVSDELLGVLAKERAFAQAIKEWDLYKKWRINRNPIRAELEATMGFDGKHAGHLIRLLRMGIEIMSTGKVYVHRPDAKELLAIRNGACGYEQIIDMAEGYMVQLDGLYKSPDCPLPLKPDMDKIDTLCQELIEEAISV